MCIYIYIFFVYVCDCTRLGVTVRFSSRTQEISLLMKKGYVGFGLLLVCERFGISKIRLVVLGIRYYIIFCI